MRSRRMSSSLTLTFSKRTRPERRVGSRFSGTSTVTPERPRSTTSTSSPAAISSRSPRPAPSTMPASPSATPLLSVTLPPRPMPAVAVPSISPGSSRDFCSADPSLAITADAMTVGTNGPGATARPSSSMTTTSSGNPYPEPPCSSSMCRPSQPSSARPCQNGGRPSSGASSSDRAAARAFCELRNPRATSASSRWSSVSAIPISRAFLLDAVGRSERVYLNPTASQPAGRSAPAARQKPGLRSGLDHDRDFWLALDRHLGANR